MQTRQLLIDDMPLTARLFHPSGAPRASVLIPAAMGVTQNYYEQFARWLAEQGYLVATFDYRGMGLSAPRDRSLRETIVTISDWALRDCPAVLAELKALAPAAPLYLVGHSLGAQLVGLLPNRHLIDGVVVVASGSGYWRETSPATKRNSLLMWHVLTPLLTPMFGYFPGKRLRVIGNLPRGVVEQWRRWCLHPEYLLGVEEASVREQYAALTTPMLSLSFTDDEMMSAVSTEALHRFYANAPIAHRRIAPRDIGQRRIGHFGFFRQSFKDTLWPLIPEWIAERS